MIDILRLMAAGIPIEDAICYTYSMQRDGTLEQFIRNVEGDKPCEISAL